MVNDFKVSICTKGRYDVKMNNKTGQLAYTAKMIGTIYTHALENDIHELDRCYLFVEPQDAEGYAKSYPEWPRTNIIVLGDNDKGVTFTRQSSLTFFQETEPCDFVMMLDDDLSVYEYKWGVHPKTGKQMYIQAARQDPLNLFDEFISFNKKLPEWEKVGISSFAYCQYGWTDVPKFPADGSLDDCTDPKIVCSNFSHSDCVVMIRPLLYKKLGIHYDSTTYMKEDRDLNAQVLYNGYYARKLCKYIMSSPLNGTVKGGCQSLYKSEGKDEFSVDYLVEKWNKVSPGFELAKSQKKETSYGRSIDVKFNWRRLFVVKERGLVKEEVFTPSDYPETIKNIKRYSEL